jgi:regulator of cell morphogenesis and NO signaling
MNASTNPENRSLTELIAHLLQHHHPYTKTALNDLSPLLDKVVRVHGDSHPELAELAALFKQLRDDMEMHLMKEEHILFPYMLALETDAPPSRPSFGTVANPIRMMMAEHHADDLILHKMLGVTGDFTLPTNACGSYTALYSGMHELVKDLFQHMRLENDILFAKAIGLEKNKLG